MTDNEKEIWRVHPEIGIIEVSSFGRVRTLEGLVLKPFDNGKGYLQVNIKVDGKFIKKRVNRLVAETFLPNPYNLPEVNHKNCDRSDNRFDNLEWCTTSYNRQYREKYGVSQTEVQGHHLFAINLSTFEISRFRSQGEAGRVLGINKGNINKVIKGKLKQTNGFWFTNDDDNAADIIKHKLNALQSRVLGL